MQQTSLEIFKQKYAFGNEQVPEDSFHRIAFALAKQEKIGNIPDRPYPDKPIEGLSEYQTYWYYQFLEALQNGAIPAGRIASNIGAEEAKPNTSLINCFAGDTPVLTRLGIKPIKELADSGLEVEVLNGNGNWSNVLFKNFGKQAVTTLEFKHADTKNNFLKVQATDNHRWILSSGQVVTTEFWTTGALFKKGYNQLDHIRPKTTELDTEQFRRGILHGAVYGDGTALAKENTYTLTLFNEKLEVYDAIGGDLLGFGSSYNSYSQENLRFTIDSTKNLKQLPAIEESISYLRGFFAGLLATDGNIYSTDTSSTYVVLYGQRELVDWCKQYLPVIGLTVTYTRKMASKGAKTNLGERKTDIYVVGIHTASIDDSLILRSLHKDNWKPADFGSIRHNYWQFQGFTKSSTELVDVYCCEEPETHSFCLANGLLTSNCTVSRNIPDSIEGIATTLKEAMLTLAKGCGIGYCCSSLRPKGAYVNGVGAETSGALSFMEIFDTMCKTIASAGGRRGAQMLTMHCWHPDILDFIKVKQEVGKFRQFNLSVLITNEFMEAVKEDRDWHLYFPVHQKELVGAEFKAVTNFPFQSPDYVTNSDGSVKCKIYKTVKAKELFDMIATQSYDYAEPAFINIDLYNEANPLNYVENIVATNPCVTGDTLILTEQGYKPIIECVGEEISVWNGKQFSKVVPKVTGEFKELLEISFSDGTTLKCTLNHKFIIKGSATRIEAKDLSYGMKLEKFSFPIIHGTKDHPDPRYAYTWGFYCGDGNSTGNSDIWLYGEKQDLRDKLLGTHSWVDTKNDRTQVTLPAWSLWFKTQVPDASMTVDFRLKWLAGLIDSDGTRSSKEGGFSIWSVDKEFLVRVKLMLNTLGVSASVVLGKEAGNKLMPDGKGGHKDYFCQESYRLLVSVWSTKQLLNLGLETFRVFLNCDPNREAGRFVTVTAIKEAGIAEKVYCFTEPLEHTGVFNGILTGNCGEQGLPEFGSCLLGSIILSKFVRNPFRPAIESSGQYVMFNYPDVEVDKSYCQVSYFDWETFDKTVRTFVRMLDNVVELHGLALPEQAHEILHKRRHGMGYTGLGTTLNLLGMKYGSTEAIAFTEEVTKRLAVINLEESYSLGEEKGCAPIFEDDVVYKHWFKHSFTQKTLAMSDWLNSKGANFFNNFAKPRFTHATSIAPTGTISLAFGNNCSNGIEPSFSHSYFRNVIVPNKKTKKRVEVLSEEALLWKELNGDAPYPEWFVTTQDITPDAHIAMQAAAQKWVDSSISKTINCPADISFEAFKDIYLKAYKAGLKGVTTYRPSGGFTAVLQTADHLETIYEFTLEDGTKVQAKARDTIWYDGEEHEVENLFCALNEGYYGKL